MATDTELSHNARTPDRMALFLRMVLISLLKKKSRIKTYEDRSLNNNAVLPINGIKTINVIPTINVTKIDHKCNNFQPQM